MMEQLLHVLNEILSLINEMSPYLLLGFLLAGLMHSFIPRQIYGHYLSGTGFRSVVLAALFGVPLPLCSCGVIPTAMSLRKEGASKGATISFLIATPQTGIDSVIATFSLMGLPFAIIRPVAALLTALFGGQLVNKVCKNQEQTTICSPGDSSTSETHHCCSHCKKEESIGFTARLRESFRYAFVEMMGDIGKWLVVGLVVAGLITVLVPDSFFSVFRGNTMMSMLLVLCISVPMYICATGSIPIAVALMLKGLTPGAALVMLMAGPACNVASILVIDKVLGKKALVAYLAAIIIGSVLFGVCVDTMLPMEWFVTDVVSSASSQGEHLGNSFSMACTILLGLLLVNSMRHHHSD